MKSRNFGKCGLTLFGKVISKALKGKDNIFISKIILFSIKNRTGLGKQRVNLDFLQ